MMMGGLDPKTLRAEARKLTQLAQLIEMNQDPKSFIEKKTKANVSKIKRKAKNQTLKDIGF